MASTGVGIERLHPRRVLWARMDSEEPLTSTLHNDSHSTSSSLRRRYKHDVIPELKSFAWIPLISMLLMHIVKPMCYDLVLPFINQMVLENGIVSDAKEVGPYAGFIESTFAAMNLITVMLWSFLSDRLGRKPIVIGGIFGLAVCIASFGMSKPYWLMVSIMAIGGIFSGTRTTMRVMLTELYPVKSHRITAFSACQITFRVGQMMGDSIGGLLVHPAERSRWFDTPFWKSYPFALPCFVSGVLSVLTGILGLFTLHETSPYREEKQISGALDTGEEEPLLAPTTVEPVPERSQALTKHVRLVIQSFTLMVFTSEAIFSLYPLFAYTPVASGGLGLPPSHIGAHMALRSGLSVVSMCLAAPIQHALGPLRTYQLGMFAWPAAVFVLPVMNVIARENGETVVGSVSFRFALGILMFAWSVAGLTWPSSQILISESPAHRSHLAMVTGISQVFQWMSMSLAPAFATTLFAFSIKTSLPIFGRNVVYAGLIALSCTAAVHSLSLSERNYQNSAILPAGTSLIDEE